MAESEVEALGPDLRNRTSPAKREDPSSMAKTKPQGMMRTFRYPLHPAKAQAEVLESWRIACQQLYNGALQERRDAWKRCRVSVTYNMQTEGLTELRREPEWAAIPVEVARSALARIDRAFKSFFRRVQDGQTPGHPRFRSVDRYDSFSIGRTSNGGIRIRNGFVRAPLIGWIRFNQYRPIKGLIKAAEIRKDCGKWFVCFACDLGEAPAKATVSSTVGIDLGLTHFATLSNGETIENPRPFRDGERGLAKAQRRLSRSKIGSAHRKAAKMRVQRKHRHVANQRVDFGRKVAVRLYERFDLIAHEDLSIRRMVHGNLAKSIHDAAWGIFIGILACKAESAGKHIVAVNPRGTSQRCSSCGATVSKTLAERTHRCGCGLVLDRDHNAALNILALAAVPGAPRELTLVDSDSAGRNEKLGNKQTTMGV